MVNLHTSRPHLKKALREESEIVAFVRSVRLTLQSVPPLLALHVRFEVPIPARNCSISRFVHKSAGVENCRLFCPRIDLSLDQVVDFVLPTRRFCCFLPGCWIHRRSSCLRVGSGSQIKQVHRLIVNEFGFGLRISWCSYIMWDRYELFGHY